MPSSSKKTALVKGILISIISGLFIILIYMTGILDRLELSAYDLRFRTVPRREVTSPVKIIAIDDYSLEKLGRWPFRRNLHAKLIDILGKAGAKAIMFDILFIEPDKTHTEDDLELENAIRTHHNVYLPIYFPSESDKGRSESFELLKTFGYKTNVTSPERADAAVIPYSGFFKNLKGTGFVNAFPDEDGVTRSVVLFIRYLDKLYPIISLQMALDHLGVLREDVSFDRGLSYKGHGGHDIHIPADELFRLKLKFPGDSYSYDAYSYADILHPETASEPVDLKVFKDKYVFVGLTATGSTDVKATPFGRTEPMITIHTALFDNIVNSDFISETSSLNDILILFALAVLMGIFLPGLKPFSGIIFAVTVLVSYLMLNFFLFSKLSISMLIVHPLLLIFTCNLVIFIYKYTRESKEKKLIRNVFSTYMTPSVVNKILKDPDSLSLGGERREMTVYFSDLAGFTTISEALSPEDLVHLINEYLEAMTNIIFNYEGTLDKYEGDAIMAFWNAPIDQEDHAFRCCCAALDCFDELKRLQKKWREDGVPELNMRIGINTGPMIVGNMGSLTRMDYTVMGDAVNLGARLESANKAYATRLMMSEFTKAQVEGRIEYRELDALKVKGKLKPVYVYEVMAKKGELSQGLKEVAAYYNAGLEFYKNRKWDEAISEFEKALSIKKDDGPSSTYIQRCRNYKTNPPPDNWNGVWELTTK